MEKIIPECIDLTNRVDLLSISDLLRERNLTVKWLVNNAGIARMAASKDFSFLEIEHTIDLNCKAPITLINICMPFMKKGSKILNISSASAFQPIPFINLYASTKAFEHNYSRALNKELTSYGITVTAVCPSCVKCQHINVKLLPQKLTMKIWLHGFKKYL